MKNVHLLSTNKPSKLYYWEDKLVFGRLSTTPINRNIYITSDEEIKIGDWVFDIFKNAYPVIRQLTTKEEVLGVQKTELKIILTTNVDLIEDGVQVIDDEFLEWFVKNPSCEVVEVVYEPKNFLDTSQGWEYMIISKIPKEEPTIEEEYLKDELKKYDCIDVVVLNKPEEPKQETLEEAAEKFAKKFGSEIDSTRYYAFINGAKWQQERMYSYEEVLEQLNLLYGMKNSLVDTFTDENDYITMKWFEQFKKK